MEVLKGDITKVIVDAIINSANTSLLGGSGVDGAIHRAGGKEILNECVKIRNRQGGCKITEAVITIGGNLPAKFVIHTVGPTWNSENKEDLLYNTYINCLKIALENNLQTLAFCCISVGKFGFPKMDAAKIAIKAIEDFSIKFKFKKIIFVCSDNENYLIYKSILNI